MGARIWGPMHQDLVEYTTVVEAGHCREIPPRKEDPVMNQLIPDDSAFGEGSQKRIVMQALAAVTDDDIVDGNANGHGDARLHAGFVRWLSLVNQAVNFWYLIHN